MADRRTVREAKKGYSARRHAPRSPASPSHLTCDSQNGRPASPASQADDKEARLRRLKGEMVYLLRGAPEGVEVSRLSGAYTRLHGRRLLLASYGLGGLQELFEALGDQVCVERINDKNVVKMMSQGEGASRPHKDQETNMDAALRDAVELVRLHPEGVPLKGLAVAFSQRYKRNLTVAALGFSSVAAFVDSLSPELLVERGVAFHRTHRATAAPPAHTATPVRPAKTGTAVQPAHTATPVRPPLTDDPQSPSPQPRDSDVTQAQLLAKVKEVIKVYPAAATNIAQLQNGFFLHFGSPLPLSLYMSLYDSQAGKSQVRASPQAKAGPQTASPSPQASSSPQTPNGELQAESPAAAPKKKAAKDAKTTAVKTPSKHVTNGKAEELVRSKTGGSPLLPSTAASPSGGLLDSRPAESPLMPQPPAASPAASGSLPGSDFPAMGATRLSRAQERRLREVGEGGGAAPVFRDAYHAQLREVHGDNVRAAEALTEEGGASERRRRKAASADEVNSLAEDVIRAIAAEGELVTIDKVLARVCTLLQVPSLQAVRIEPRWQLPAVKDLQRTIKEVNMFIESAEAVCAVCTLHELGQALAGLKNKKRFEELHLGPLCKHPLVHRMFKVDGSTKDEDIHQIETVDILRSLRLFRRKQGKPGRVDLADFMKFLADQYDCDSPYELGIRIQSIGLPISTLMKASTAEHGSLERAREAMQREVEEEVQAKLWKIKKILLDPAQGAMLFSHAGSSELRKKYSALTASEAVLEVFTHSDGIFNPKMTKRVQDFLMHVSGDRLARVLFQLAICCGSLEVPSDLVAKEKPRKQVEERRETEEERACKMPPTQAAVKQYFQECVSSLIGVLSLPYLSRLEKKVADHFKFRDFWQLNQGSFLEFLVKHSQVLQEAAGGAVTIGSQDVRACGFRPSQQDVYEFITQCGEAEPSRLPFIEAALRSHYRVRDSRELGYGPLQTQLGIVQRQRGLSDSVRPSLVRYECPLLPTEPGDGVTETVGLLGDVRREQAVASLLSAPLLQDLAEWSQWELVFQPSHGPLKDFIERNCVNSDLVALEVTPGVLLRVTTSTGDKLFSEAAMTLDPVGTAGHLVSMVVADGISNAPTALLANHMEGSLAAAVAQEDLTQAGDDGCCFATVARFVLECVVRMPTRICRGLMQQVFLEPLSRVLGQAKSKGLLLEAARSDAQYLNKLHQLGILLGITEWVRDFHTKLVLPKTPDPPLHTPEVPSKINKQGMAADSMSSRSSVLSLSEGEDYPEDPASAPASSSESSSPGRAEQEDDDDDDEEDLFELLSDQDGDADSGTERQVDGGDELTGDQLCDAGLGEEEPADDQTESRLGLRKAVIDDIRKSEFGVGVELSEEGRDLMKVHQERLGRSLDRLSTELYSKDTHFVLELIQNADDNRYPLDRADQPALAFVVERDCVTILNNECGFEEENVRAICDVGRSTKGKHKYGYIGQKGIGFKSVFKVTDRPEIHSNDFHIRFDKTSGPMGYILPHWLQDERPLSAGASEIAQHSWTTKISLPLRSESYQTRNLFHDLHPSLLLFLHRLRSITIFNETEKRLVSMTRRDLNHDILEVEHTGGLERWLVVKRMLFPKKIKEDVESTELALAFQLSDASGADVNLQPQKQPVFAFLPLRSFGFRFIIQGDFDIPSSREDVDRDSSWNQWLRSEIPQLFLHAMDTFNKHPEFSGLKGLCHFLQFIPLPNEILDFFHPVANQIIQLLKGKPCLPAKEDSGGAVEFKLPLQLTVCQDPLIQEVIGGEDLRRHLNLSYLHPTLQAALPASLLSALGVHRLRGADITTVTCAMAKELVQGGNLQSGPDLRSLARLLVCNFRALEAEFGEVDAMLQSLRDIPMVPLADGRVVALSGEGVFFPLGDTKSAHTVMEALCQDLSIVTPGLLSCLDALGNSQVRELLRRLQVHELEPQQVLREHVYPILRSGAWKTKPKDVTVSYLVFIKLHSEDQDYRSLNATIPVLTNRGFVCPREGKVQFSKQYDNIDLPTKLPGVDWVLLHPCYVQVDGDVSGWRELFSSLGVRDLLIFRKEKRAFMSKELASSPWAVDSELWPKTADGVCVIEDYQGEEFCALASTDQLSTQNKLEQRRTLLELLDKNWDTGDKYSQYLRAQVLDSQGRCLKDTKSSFCHFLSRLPWVPAFRMQRDGRRSVEYLIPSAVYLFSLDIHSLLGTHVPYVDMAPSEFSRAVGMRHTVSVEEMVGYLKTWCTKAGDDPSEGGEQGAEFTSTVEHIHTVYSYLQRTCPLAQLKDLFQHSPAVFIEYERREEWSSGRFYQLKEVCWNDPTGMFLRYKEQVRQPDSGVQEPRALAPFYSFLPDMRNLFLTLLSVEANPSMRQYVDLLDLVCELSPLPTGDVLQDVSIIFAKLADKCKMPQHGDQEQDTQLDRNYCTSLKEMVSDKRVFPTKSGVWVTLARRPMIPDSSGLEKIFKSHSQVCLLNLPSAHRRTAHRAKPSLPHGKLQRPEDRPAFSESDRELFLEICGVCRLSHCVAASPQTENYRPCPAMQALVSRVLPYIQRFIFLHPDVYGELQEGGIGRRVKALTFGQVGKLYIHYQLDLPDGDTVFEQEDIICLLKDQRELYIQKDNLSAKLDICRELVKLFSSDSSFGKELEHFLEGLVASINDEAALRRFLDRKDIRDLPSEDERWEVPEPEPVEVKPEPPALSGVHFSPAVCVPEDEQDGADTLVCWPPKSSFSKSGSSHTGPALDAVMKMWPPPAPPPQPGSAGVGSHAHTGEPTLPREPGAAIPPGTRSSTFTPYQTDKTQEGERRGAQSAEGPPPKPSDSFSEGPLLKSSGGFNDNAEPRDARPGGSRTSTPSAAEDQQAPPQQSPSRPCEGPEVVSSQFQGSGGVQRPLLPLDAAVWGRATADEAVLEDLVLDCSLPTTVAFTEDFGNTADIGEWGERLVHSFLTHWRASGAGHGPRDVTWYNQDGESGQPCDFKVTFSDDGESTGNDLREIFVEVKTTIKREKHFIHLSANELDFALKEKEKYHIYRVYGAGDSQNVRLCRIQNLAQHLHSKTLELFLFV